MGENPVFSDVFLEDNDFILKESDLWNCEPSIGEEYFTHDAILNLVAGEESSKPLQDVSSQSACPLFNALNDQHLDQDVQEYLQILSDSIPKHFLSPSTSVSNILRGASQYIKQMMLVLQSIDHGETGSRNGFHAYTSSPPSSLANCQYPHNSDVISYSPSTSCRWCPQCCYPNFAYVTATSPYYLGHTSDFGIVNSTSSSTNGYTAIKEKNLGQYNGDSNTCTSFSSLGLYEQCRPVFPQSTDQGTLPDSCNIGVNLPQYPAPPLLTEEIREQFRNEYSALSSILDDYTPTSTLTSTDDIDVASVSNHGNSRRGSDSTDTELDLSMTADDDVFLENCVNPDDVIANQHPPKSQEPDSTTESQNTEKDKNRKAPVRRPKNGFIRFSIEYRKNHTEPLKKDNREISKMLGAKWRRMSREEKKPYENGFRNDIEDLKKKHPDWRYAPMKRLSHDQLEPMPSRLRPRDKLKRRFLPSIAKGEKLGKSLSSNEGNSTKPRRRRSQKEKSQANIMGFVWIQCCLCGKWRHVPLLNPAPSNVFYNVWICPMNPDRSCNSCAVDEDWRVRQGRLLV